MKQEVADGSSTSMGNLWTASFGEVDAVLSEIHDIDSARRTAFQARLKHFLKLGALENVKQGRGKAARYSPADLVTLATLCELVKFGITPENSIALIQTDKYAIASATEKSLEFLNNHKNGDLLNDVDNQVVLFFVPNNLSNLSKKADIEENLLNWTMFKIFADSTIKFSAIGRFRTMSFLNFTSLIREIVKEVPRKESFWGCLNEWVDEMKSQLPDGMLPPGWIG